MKQFLVLLIAYVLMTFHMASAQAKLPDFVIADIYGKYHRISNSNNKKQVLFIYFMPDCEDCKAFTTKLLNNKRIFIDYKVIMVTNSNLLDLKKFVADFGLKDKKSLVIGTEGWTATLQRLLNVERFPFVQIYTAKGNLAYKFTDSDDIKLLFSHHKFY